MVLRSEPRALSRAGKQSTTELHFQPLFLFKKFEVGAQGDCSMNRSIYSTNAKTQSPELKFPALDKNLDEATQLRMPVAPALTGRANRQIPRELTG